MHNGEVICIHIGQAGIQMGQAAWELLTTEHGISADGTKKDCIYDEGSLSTFFQETPSGQLVPRSLFIDLEPSVIDEIRVGSFGRVFHPDLMISGMEDSGSNYARARYSRGMHMMPLLIDKVRYVAESCDTLQGFMLFSSFGGGTGSGLCALFLNRLEHEFHRLPRIHVGIFPGPKLSPVVVEPYNSTLFTADLLEQADFSILLDNTALCNVFKVSLGIDRPTYAHLNRLCAQIISHVTSTLRFPNTLNNSLHEMQVNLIPYPQIKFPVSSFSPIQCLDRSRHDVMGTEALTRSVFSRGNLMVSCNLKRGLFMANSMIYRGPFDSMSVNQAITCVKRESNWVTWCPTGFKIGMSHQKPMFMNSSLLAPSDRSVFMISNTTAIQQVLNKLRRKCYVMYAKQAFVHHYTNEGLEEDELKLAYEEISKLEGLYNEIQSLDHDENFANGDCENDSDSRMPNNPRNNKTTSKTSKTPTPNDTATTATDITTTVSEQRTDIRNKSNNERYETDSYADQTTDEACKSDIDEATASALDVQINVMNQNKNNSQINHEGTATDVVFLNSNAHHETPSTSHDDVLTSKRRSKLLTKAKFHFSKLMKW